jgi:hypothetical protein
VARASRHVRLALDPRLFNGSASSILKTRPCPRTLCGPRSRRRARIGLGRANRSEATGKRSHHAAPHLKVARDCKPLKVGSIRSGPRRTHRSLHGLAHAEGDVADDRAVASAYGLRSTLGRRGLALVDPVGGTTALRRAERLLVPAAVSLLKGLRSKKTLGEAIPSRIDHQDRSSPTR